MKTSLLLVLVTGMFLVLTAGSCLQGKHIVGSKNYISKEVKADHFNEIKLVGSANIIGKTHAAMSKFMVPTTSYHLLKRMWRVVHSL